MLVWVGGDLTVRASDDLKGVPRARPRSWHWTSRRCHRWLWCCGANLSHRLTISSLLANALPSPVAAETGDNQTIGGAIDVEVDRHAVDLLLAGPNSHVHGE
jgi:hypothetical protein